MAKEYAKDFYNSKSWKTTRDSYFNDVFGICERCKGAGEIVHHKIHITPSNINNPNITLNKDNLQLLCRSCHAIIHEGTDSLEEGFYFDEGGNLVENKSIYNRELS